MVSVALVGSLIVAPVVDAATYTVNSTDDASDVDIGDGVCDADPGAALQCTLRAAINEANSDTTADTITLPAGIYVLDIPRAGTGSANDGDGETGDLDIDRDVSIVGAGVGQTIVSGSGLVSASTDRIFHFRGAGTDVSLSGMTIEGGRYGGTGGAAIHNTAGGIVSIDNILVRDISAAASGPITNQGSGAGSAVNVMRMSNSTIMTSYGSNTGAILQDYSGTKTRTLELLNVTIASTSHGSFPNNRNGAIRIDKGEASLSHVTVFNNRYGLDVESAVVTVSNSLFVDNGDDLTGRNCRTDIQPVDSSGLPSGGVIAGGTITSLGGNYSSDASCTFFSLPSDVNGGGNPGLADMIEDAGAVVVPFYAGSEVTSSAACAAVDQTGTARAATCVVGAYETTITPPQLLASPAFSAGTVNGVVFRDYNDNGQRDIGEPAVPGVNVAAYTGSATAIDSTVTDANGQYALATGSATVRIEFTNIPAWLKPGAVGSDSDTTIRFVDAPASKVNLSLFNPAQYCESDPRLATSCYLFGDQTTYLSEDTLVAFNFSDGSGSRSDGSVIGENGFGGSGNPTGPWAYTDPPPDHVATGSTIGTTWGMAYQRSSGDLFVSAFHKRHAGQGPDGPGAIYRVDPTGVDVVSTLIVLADVATDPHATNGGDYSLDSDAWDAVGRASLGDMDISDDDNTLFVANLEARTLDVIDIGSATRVNQVAIPDSLPGAETGCVAADVMPFAVSHNDGVTYLGLVCSATSTQAAADLRAYVYGFDGSNFGTAPVLEFSLAYAHGESYGGDSYALSGSWRPWTPQAVTYSGQIPGGYFDQEVVAGDNDVLRASYPQPMLADIEFDNGDMVLAIMDRTGHQQANQQRLPDGSGIADTDPVNAITLVDNVEAAGDILRACSDGAGGWSIESNASCGATTTAGAGNLEGPDDGEYYFEDAFLTAHPEVLIGGLEQIPGRNNVVYAAYDPVLWNRDFNSGGIHWASNEFGSWQKGYRLYDTRLGQPTFAKANGLGDIEALCAPAPIEIGNFVWIDTDKDGLQDPGETPVAGALIGLYDASGTLIAIVETNADGQYLFSSDTSRPDVNSDGDANPEFDYGIPGFGPNQNYTVAILDSNFDPGAVLDGWTPTVSDDDLNRRDSDAVPVAVGAAANAASLGVEVRTGVTGANNHTYDFGFIPPVYDLALVKTLKAGQSAWVLDGDTVAYEVEIKNQGNVASDVFSVTDVIPFGMSYVAASGSNFSCTFVAGTPPTVADEVLCTYSPPNAAALAPGASAIIQLTLRVDDLTQAPFKNWAEIEEDSSTKYGVTDDDSNPGDHNASDNGPGPGTSGSDPSIDHNDISHSGSNEYDDALEDEDDSDPALIRAASTTPITLSFFTAREQSDETALIHWRTSTEEANLGFHIYARGRQGWRRLNDSLIPTRSSGDTGGVTKYVVRYAVGKIREFAISDVDTTGNEILHGPFAINERYGSMDISAVSSTNNETDDEWIPVLYRETLSRQQVYADVDRAGIHLVTFRQLQQAGLDWTGIAAADIAVTRRGEAVARHIRGGVTINSNSVIEFLATDLNKNPYSKTTRYLIDVDAGRAQPVASATALVRSNDNLRIARAELVFEKDSHYSRLAPGDDPWYMDKMLSLGNSVESHYSFDLNDLASAASSRLSVDVWGGNNDYSVDREHRVIITVNGKRLASRRFEGIREKKIEVDVAPGILKRRNNTVTLGLRSRGRTHPDLVYVDRVALRYSRKLRDDRQFTFQTDGRARTIELVDASDAIVYRRANNETIRLSGIKRRVGDNILFDLRADGVAGEVFVSSSRRGYRPKLRRAAQSGELFTASADYLIISHSKFRTADLRRLIEARESQGYRVQTVNTGWIYRAYSGGERDANAIARYIDDAVTRMGVSYVLLVGDDTYDYRNNLKRSSTSYVPSLFAATDGRIKHVPTDPLYGDIDDDGVPDVVVGRMPVSTKRELRHLVDKTLQYAKSVRSAGVLLGSDRRDGASRHSFRRDSKPIQRKLANENWSVSTAHVDAVGSTRARQRILGTINSGVRLVNYIGHSDRNRWGFDSLLSVEDLARLDNAASPTIVTQFGCWNNDYTTVATSTLGESLLVDGDYGAAAVIGSTTLSNINTQARLAELFYTSITQPGKSIGMALHEAKMQLAVERPYDRIRDMLLGVVVLGDPALIPFPQR